MNNEGLSKGLYDKYIITKRDGTTDQNAVYFVLRIDTDKSAQAAARFYADWVRTSNKRLSDELLSLLDMIELAQRTGAEGPMVISGGDEGEE